MQDRLDSARCARYLKILADPDRLKIIQLLWAGPKTVSELAELLNKELVNVSHHLRVLHRAQMVQTEKQGKFVIYTLEPTLCRCKSSECQSGCIELECCRIEW
jgi:DNA-binding transcriptional ArsR family regulator